MAEDRIKGSLTGIRDSLTGIEKLMSKKASVEVYGKRTADGSVVPPGHRKLVGERVEVSQLPMAKSLREHLAGATDYVSSVNGSSVNVSSINASPFRDPADASFAPPKGAINKIKTLRERIVGVFKHHVYSAAIINGCSIMPTSDRALATAIGEKMVSQVIAMLEGLPLLVWSTPIWDMALAGHGTFEGTTPSHEVLRDTMPMVWAWEDLQIRDGADSGLGEHATQVFSIVWKPDSLGKMGIEQDFLAAMYRQNNGNHEDENGQKYDDFVINGDTVLFITIYVPIKPNSAATGLPGDIERPYTIPRIVLHTPVSTQTQIAHGNAYTVAALHFLQQRVVGLGREPKNRADVRRELKERGKKGVTHYPDTQYVMLRRLERKGGGDGVNPDGSGREYKHQWLVSGFWRSQPCGPRNSLRRPTYVEPHLRGPEGAPMLPPRETVFVAKR